MFWGGVGWVCQVLATQWVLTVVDGITKFLQHHFQRRVLGQFHHEHTSLHTDVARVGLTWRAQTGDGEITRRTGEVRALRETSS